MFGTVCPQCKKTPNGTDKRLVKDSCGHEKCRVCLLLDEEKCQQCESSTLEVANVPLPPLKNEEPSVIKCDNHTGVITCNGSPKKPEGLSNGVKDKELCNDIKPPPNVPKLKTKRTKAENKKRAYQSIVIPNHVTVLKEPLRYKCNICNKQFNTKTHIKYHIYCTGQIKPLRCDLCSKDFVTKQHLDVHMLKHSGTKPYSCDICQKAFREKSKLKRHTLLHSSTKPYVCAECGKAFRSRESLKLHMLIHRGEKPFSCRICSLTFNNTSNLNKHLISHSNDKTHMCDECGKTFKLKWALTVHRRSHQRDRPFECNACHRTFVNNKDLQRHQLIHLETKGYVCSICTTSFRRKDNLYRHVKNTHPGKKVDRVTTTVKQLLTKPSSKPVDNPNAINVIKAPLVCKPKTESKIKTANRTGTVINGPLKLAFKTDEFKSNYNIHRSLAESVNICHKILSPDSPPSRNVRKADISDTTTLEMRQKLLTPFPSKPLHYETSFEHKKHAIIKNIKFKLPSYYTNLNKSTESLKGVTPLNPTIFLNDLQNNNNNTYAELKSTPGTTSVIVNTNASQSNNLHWRRRTSQTLYSKFLEN